TAEFSLGTDLARNTGHFRSERAELIDHRVYSLGRAQKLSFQLPTLDFRRHGLRKVALSHGPDDSRHFAGWSHQVADQFVNGLNSMCPRIRNIPHRCSLGDASFFAYHSPDSIELHGKTFILSDDLVKGGCDFSSNSGPVVGKASGKITSLKCH